MYPGLIGRFQVNIKAGDVDGCLIGLCAEVLTNLNTSCNGNKNALMFYLAGGFYSGGSHKAYGKRLNDN